MNEVRRGAGRVRRRAIAAAAGAVAVAAAVPAAGAGPAETPGPVGERIVFARHCGTGCSDVYAIRPDGSELVRLTQGRDSFDPALSADGRRVVFASERGGRAGAPELYAMDADGRGLRRLTRTAAGVGGFTASFSPALSPDGRSIAFVRLSVRGGRSQQDVFVMSADGTNLRRLTRTAAAETEPAFSPDGRRIAFTRSGAVHVIDATGGSTARVGPGSAPAYSPDGRQLAVRTARGIVLIDLERGTRRSLVRDRSAGAPAFSPDGARVVYESARGLRTVATDGGAGARLTRPPGLHHDLAPSWAGADRRIEVPGGEARQGSHDRDIRPREAAAAAGAQRTITRVPIDAKA